MVTTRLQKGVTLIELIVVVGIVSVVSTVLLFNYSDFSASASLRNLSQEIALSVRKAQSFATSVQGIDPSGGGVKSYPAYGIAFSLGQPSGPLGTTFTPSQKEFILFADIPLPAEPTPNKKYDSNGTCGTPVGGAECMESFSINSADKIVGIQTNTTGGFVDTGSIYITFRRPSPDAIFCYMPNGSSSCDLSVISYAKIKVRSVKGTERIVSVWNTGQISVE